MDINTILIAAIILIIIVVFFGLRHKRNVKNIMADNNNVIPLMMQKSTQAKVTRLNQATTNNQQANEQLQKLVAAYKNHQIDIQDYNEKLDKMIAKLNIDL